MRCTVCNQQFKKGDLIDVEVRNLKWDEGFSLMQIMPDTLQVVKHHDCAVHERTTGIPPAKEADSC